MIAPAEQKPDLDKYEVFEEIGHGGMATVYRARDRRLGREVAVKVIHRHLRESAEVAARFSSEARAVAMLRHPNMVEVYDVSEDDDPERYLIVELVRGPTLRKLLSRHSHVPAEVAAGVALEVAAALEHAHEQGVIHRDVKPENVLCELPVESPPSARESERGRDSHRGPRIKITDFGIAKLLDAQGVTSTGQVLGSPAHMAPEQIEGGEVSARSDVFGLGVLLYECMVGRLPFDGKNPAQVLRRVLDGTYPTADRERPTVGARWSAILDRALARESGDRWESARAFADAIHAELEQLGFAEPRRDIAEFFADPDAYAKAHEERIVARLVELGEQARATGDVPAAAAHFNRALAYRPSDPDLLRRVTGLARAVRLRRTLRRAGLVLAGSAAFAGLAFAVGRALRGTAAATAASAEARGARRHDGARLPIGPEPATRAGAVASGSPLATGRRAPKLHFPRPPASASAPTGTRQVKISTPTQGAIVSIDGAEVDIREIHALSVGSHTLEFAPPPDTDCCLKSSKTVIVLEGEGVQTLSGALAFKDATISVSGGPSGTTVTCPLLAPGQHAVPATIKVRMSKTTATGACTLTPPESSGEAPVSKTVSLTAGKTVNLTWP